MLNIASQGRQTKDEATDNNQMNSNGLSEAKRESENTYIHVTTINTIWVPVYREYNLTELQMDDL